MITVTRTTADETGGCDTCARVNADPASPPIPNYQLIFQGPYPWEQEGTILCPHCLLELLDGLIAVQQIKPPKPEVLA